MNKISCILFHLYITICLIISSCAAPAAPSQSPPSPPTTQPPVQQQTPLQVPAPNQSPSSPQITPKASTITPTPKERVNVVIPSLKNEVDRIWWTIKRIDFYDQYKYILTFPGIPEMATFLTKARANKLEDSDYTSLSRLMEEKIYKSDDYTQAYNKVIDALPTVEQAFPTFDKYNQKWSFKIFPVYSVLLTLYGVGGSYDDSKGQIIMRITKEASFQQGWYPQHTIIHEMVHIGIEDNIIQPNSIEQRVKERIVDKFVNYHFVSLLPDYRMQSMGDISIDPYLNGQEAWDNLPARVKEFKSR
jgi:hypothetical protein